MYKGLKRQFRVSLTLTSWRGTENNERNPWLVDNAAVADEAIPWSGGPEAFVSIRERKNVFENILLLKCCLSDSSLGYWLQLYLGILGILLICKRLSCNPLDFCANLGVIYVQPWSSYLVSITIMEWSSASLRTKPLNEKNVIIKGSFFYSCQLILLEKQLNCHHKRAL